MHDPNYSGSLRRLLFAVASVAAVALAGCKFDVGVEGANGIPFSCTADEPCLDGYLCVFGDAGSGEGAVGQCVSATEEEETCFDRDRDRAFAGNCPEIPSQALDCDDNDLERNPGATEVCDGVDNDCDCDGDSNGDGTVCGPGDEGVDEELPLKPCNLSVGICAGTSVGCIGGEYPDCAEVGIYPDTFERSETSCDGIDNDCDGQVDIDDPDSDCACDPSTTEAVECGIDSGACTRGIQICNEDASLTGCLEARVGRVCEGDGATPCETNRDCFDGTTCIPQECATSDDCGANGYCVQEVVLVAEDVFDTCTTETSVDGAPCARSVCRYLAEDAPCADDSECAEGEACVNAFCQSTNVGRANETCNGIDDDCDGRIDNDAQRDAICGRCPYNMVLTPLLPATGAPNFVCVDRYEASRPDATADDEGALEFYATSRAGVRPWTGVDPEVAKTACLGTEYRDLLGSTQAPLPPKRLCTTVWYQQGCGGVQGSSEFRPYPYGEPAPNDEYVAGQCVDASLGLSGPALTGSAPECCLAPLSTSPDVTTCDMVGNVAEWVQSAGGLAVLAGGSYADTDPAILSCGDGVRYTAAPDVEDFSELDTIGFRCCTLPNSN